MSPVQPFSRRSGGPLVFAAAAAAVVIGASGCTIDLSEFRPGGGEEPSPSPTPVKAPPLLESALETLRSQPAVTVQGQISPSQSSTVSDISLTTTRAGAASGTMQVNEAEAQVMQADDRIFVNASDAYWLDRDIVNPDTGSYADTWTRVTGEQVGVDPAAMLAPAQLADIIAGMAPDTGRARLENLDGTTAYRVDLQGGEQNRVWIGEESGELLRAEIEQLAPKGADSGPRSRLNFSVPESSEVQTLYDDVLAVAQDELKNSPDARMAVAWKGQLDLSCETGGACSVSGTVQDESGSGGDMSVLVRMDANVKNDELGSKKCDDSASLEAGGSVELSCGVDFALAPSTSPQTYQMSGDARLSTQALSGDAREELVSAIEEQRDAAASGASPSAPASESPSAAQSAGN
ncbi:LolA-like protein [Streptomonospora litoralis]|uniref:Uncharacterized protein n=1 Tax=Streptomonospora litoralis TaxID=2498135 RepID=A0A4P6Q4U4_9ACTN|nr:hypothetical protein [Streptomonospora litoralis]QBI55675.1 hypothetical protein EKD16_19560 [Streptomonospora litoralis]